MWLLTSLTALAAAAAAVPLPSEQEDAGRVWLLSLPRNITFDCRGRIPGYYADVESGCQMYHMCDPQSRLYSYLCPAYTEFSQFYMTCVQHDRVNCSMSEKFFHMNEMIGKPRMRFHDLRQHDHSKKKDTEGSKADNRVELSEPAGHILFEFETKVDVPLKKLRPRTRGSVRHSPTGRTAQASRAATAPDSSRRGVSLDPKKTHSPPATPHPTPNGAKQAPKSGTQTTSKAATVASFGVKAVTPSTSRAASAVTPSPKAAPRTLFKTLAPPRAGSVPSATTERVATSASAASHRRLPTPGSTASPTTRGTASRGTTAQPSRPVQVSSRAPPTSPPRPKAHAALAGGSDSDGTARNKTANTAHRIKPRLRFSELGRNVSTTRGPSVVTTPAPSPIPAPESLTLPRNTYRTFGLPGSFSFGTLLNQEKGVTPLPLRTHAFTPATERTSTRTTAAPSVSSRTTTASSTVKSVTAARGPVGAERSRKSSTAEPAVVKPTVKPATVKTTQAPKTTSRKSTTISNPAQSTKSTTKPTTAKPTTTRPSTNQASASKSLRSQSTTKRPTTTRPTTAWWSATKIAKQKALTTNVSTTSKPATTQLPKTSGTTTKKTVTTRGTERTTTERPTAKQSTTKRTTTEQTTTQRTTTKQTTTQRTTTKQTTSKRPTTRPTTKRPITFRPATTKRATTEPTTTKQTTTRPSTHPRPSFGQTVNKSRLSTTESTPVVPTPRTEPSGTTSAAPSLSVPPAGKELPPADDLEALRLSFTIEPPRLAVKTDGPHEERNMKVRGELISGEMALRKLMVEQLNPVYFPNPSVPLNLLPPLLSEQEEPDGRQTTTLTLPVRRRQPNSLFRATAQAFDLLPPELASLVPPFLTTPAPPSVQSSTPSAANVTAPSGPPSQSRPTVQPKKDPPGLTMKFGKKRKHFKVGNTHGSKDDACYPCMKSFIKDFDSCHPCVVIR